MIINTRVRAKQTKEIIMNTSLNILGQSQHGFKQQQQQQQVSRSESYHSSLNSLQYLRQYRRASPFSSDYPESSVFTPSTTVILCSSIFIRMYFFLPLTPLISAEPFPRRFRWVSLRVSVLTCCNLRMFFLPLIPLTSAEPFPRRLRRVSLRVFIFNFLNFKLFRLRFCRN